jgi:hypothetical protein
MISEKVLPQKKRYAEAKLTMIILGKRKRERSIATRNESLSKRRLAPKNEKLSDRRKKNVDDERKKMRLVKKREQNERRSENESVKKGNANVKRLMKRREKKGVREEDEKKNDFARSRMQGIVIGIHERENDMMLK